MKPDRLRDAVIGAGDCDAATAETARRVGAAIADYDGIAWTGSSLTIHHSDDPRVTRQLDFARAAARRAEGSPKRLFAILELLFSEREAELVSQLPIKPFTAKKADTRHCEPNGGQTPTDGSSASTSYRRPRP